MYLNNPSIVKIIIKEEIVKQMDMPFVI